MEQWICKVCGYTHEGKVPPERCPQCNAPKSKFYKKGSNKGCAMLLLFLSLIPASLILAILSCGSSTTVDNSVVSSVDLNKYLGKWYEIARFDHRFERNMMHCSATYTMQDNGMIKVTNRGIKEGKWKTSIGKAKLTDKPGVLRVSFFGPFYSDYRIMMLAPDYSYALVGGDNDSYLWILSRTPQLKQSTLNIILSEARRRGYDTNNLIWVQQKDT